MTGRSGLLNVAVVVAAGIALVGLAGCTGESGPSPPDATASSTPGGDADGSSPTASGSGQAPVSATHPSLAMHPSGASLRLVDATHDGTRVAVVVELLNASSGEQSIDLAAESGVTFDGATFVPAEDDPVVAPGELTEMTVVVQDVIADSLAGVDLVLNPNGQDSDSAAQPRLALAVPEVRPGEVPITTGWTDPKAVAVQSYAALQQVEASSQVAIDGVVAESSAEVRTAEIISDFDGEVVDAGTVLTVPAQVLFDVDESRLRDDAQESLDDIVEVLEFYPDASVQVTGHTDSTASDAYNQELSEQRAAAVTDYLVAAGIDQARLSTQGRGELQPRATNDTEQGRQLNRRVEILVEGVTPPGD